MKRNIKGFAVDWAGNYRVLAERENDPKYKYEFEVSADWKRVVGRIWRSHPDDERFDRDAGKAVEEFLRIERDDQA